jgi:uncharacterized membrane protein
MAAQKRARAASTRAKSSGTAAGGTAAGGAGARADTATRSASANSKRANRTTQAGAVRAGQPGGGPGARGPGGRGQDPRGQGGRGQGGRGQGGRGPDTRGRNGRPASAPARSGARAAEPLAAGSAARPSAPRWFQLTTLILSLGGLGVSIYLTVVHYTSLSNLACSASGAINCEKVITSPESMVFGVFPVAVLGLAFYVFMVAISTPWAWRSRLPAIGWARLGGVVTGMGFVLYLLYAEIVQIGNICLWCTSVHVITFLLFVLLVFQATFGTGATARDAR